MCYHAVMFQIFLYFWNPAYYYPGHKNRTVSQIARVSFFKKEYKKSWDDSVEEQSFVICSGL